MKLRLKLDENADPRWRDALMRLLAVALERESPIGKLWILEPGRLRIHQDTSD